jgi:quercetin dioxygenase-like cupin family protein
MAYKRPPHPQFPGPARIPYDSVAHHVWGDAVSGEVADWIYVSTPKICQLVWGLPPGGAFRHSEDYKTIFAADEVYIVLSGTLVLANPERGEVHRLRTGEAAFFRRDTWHHGFSYGTEPLRVLEYLGPPPASGAGGVYALTKPNLERCCYGRDDLLGRWPMAQEQFKRDCTFQVLREADILWRLEGVVHPIAVGILASTEHLTVGRVHLLPGQQSDAETHAGDEALYVLEGTLHVLLSEGDKMPWHELRPRDGFFVPEGTPHRYSNQSDQPVTFLFGIAPQYRRSAS